MKVQKVLKASVVSGKTLNWKSAWKITLSCGAITYRPRQMLKGFKLYPAPKKLNCFCPKCAPMLHQPTVECFGYADEYEQSDYASNW